MSESPRLYGLISERPSTSKGYSRERDRLHTEQNNRLHLDELNLNLNFVKTHCNPNLSGRTFYQSLLTFVTLN